ncbi:MAG TPA: MarR family transcriptional regulator [Pseudonocardia sp.]|uniref:MarR family winged helix-turn-helix transcriptional regulator n=1 Tax=Pseudonocardia sp. TaxID=60912 RepID=UPI002ED8DC8D
MSKSSGLPGLEADLASRPGHVMHRAAQALLARKTSVLREFGLTVPQYGALVVLSYLPGASAAQLSRVCLVTPQSMATVLSNLEAKGLIERRPSDVHQKVQVTRLTRAGRALLKRADAQARAVEDRLSEAYTDQERDQLYELLERAIKLLS